MLLKVEAFQNAHTYTYEYIHIHTYVYMQYIYLRIHTYIKTIIQRIQAFELLQKAEALQNTDGIAKGISQQHLYLRKLLFPQKNPFFC